MRFKLILLSFVVLYSCNKQIDYDYLPYINSLQSSVSALQKSRDSLVNIININNASLSALQKSRDSLSNALGQTNSNLSNLLNSNATILKSLDTIKIQLVGINTQINSLVTQLNATNANILSISTQISALNQLYLDLLAKYNAIIAQLNAAPSTLTTNLIAYYPFTGNANDSSGNGYHGIVNGATLTTDRFGKSNAAYYFNGTSSFIDVTNKFFDNGWENSTITVWFNTATHQSPAYYGGQTLINTNCFNGFDLGYSYQASKRIYVYKNSNPAVSWDILKNDPFNFTPINLNTWYFLTVIKSGLTYTYYINGQLDKTITTSIAPSVNNMYPIRIGGVITPLPTDNRELFTGNIDDIRIYNRALSQTEITYLSNH